MAQLRHQTISNAERLLGLVERYNLFHVKTLCYNDVESVLAWIGVNPDNFTFRQNEDTVTVLNNVITEHSLTTVGVVSISDEPQLEGKDRIVVYIKRDSAPATVCSKYDSIVLFRVIQCSMSAPYSPELNKLIRETQTVVHNRRTPIFPTFASATLEDLQAMPQQEHPVIDGCSNMSYKTTTPRTAKVTIDKFGRMYKPLSPTEIGRRWSIYANISGPTGSKCEFDIEDLVSRPDMVLGRGGFGVTVKVNDHLVAKTNLFPEMVDWSVPFIDNEFSRYAHIASQVEEVMIGVSIKHPNILRTFGGFWCDMPGYQLGGRAVIVMERALFSLQEFMWRIQNTSVVPMVELDTLRGLEYLRSRTIQHRDFTHRNVLVCHQPDRKAIPFAFKISDFGTSCNFSTPDQPRGNRTNMAPEVLWCLNSATGSDIFSWYCVMWELHSRSPLFQYKGSDQEYCKMTYAANLSDMVGVYRPDDDETLDIRYMRSISASFLQAKYKHTRPSARTIRNKLSAIGSKIVDKAFVNMGVLCITLFPQERWSPSTLLNLRRYQCLALDVKDAQSPSTQMPLSVQVGNYRSTDIIVANDCVPKDLTTLVEERSATRFPVTVIGSDPKVYYGIDLIRLAPDLIQPYSWYSSKVTELECLYKSKYSKRKVAETDNQSEVRPSKMAPGVYVDRPDMGTSNQHCPQQQLHPRPSVIIDMKQTRKLTDELHPVQSKEAYGMENSVTPDEGHVSRDVSLLDLNNLEWSDNLADILSCSNLGDEIVNNGNCNIASVGDNSNKALDLTIGQAGASVNNLIVCPSQGPIIEASGEDASNPPRSTLATVKDIGDATQGRVNNMRGKMITALDLTKGQVGASVDNRIVSQSKGTSTDASGEGSPKPPSSIPATEPAQDIGDDIEDRVSMRGKRIEGEINTTMVILKSTNEKEIARFKDCVVIQSQSMTQMHPLIFAGPRDGLCKCSMSKDVFIFQYAQLFDDCKQVFNWTVADSPNSVYAFLLQVFLTLKVALDTRLLPTHMTEWRYILIGKGAVMIDIVPYLSRNFNKPSASMFSDQCKNLTSLCATMVAKHLPDSNLCKWLCNLSTGTSTSQVLTDSIEWLRQFNNGERTSPHLLTLLGRYFTFRDYTSEIPDWLTYLGEKEDARNRSCGKLLVYGEPQPYRGNQTAEGPGDTKLSTLVRNIVLRMRVKIFGSSRLEVTTLDCTQGLTKVTLNVSALSGIARIDQLDRSTELLTDNGSCFTHDLVSQIESKWAPVILFTKCKRQGPVQEFTLNYYKMTILMVLMSLEGSAVLSLRELFNGVTTFSVTEY